MIAVRVSELGRKHPLRGSVPFCGVPSSSSGSSDSQNTRPASMSAGPGEKRSAVIGRRERGPGLTQGLRRCGSRQRVHIGFVGVIFSTRCGSGWGVRAGEIGKEEIGIKAWFVVFGPAGGEPDVARTDSPPICLVIVVAVFFPIFITTAVASESMSISSSLRPTLFFRGRMAQSLFWFLRGWLSSPSISRLTRTWSIINISSFTPISKFVSNASDDDGSESDEREERANADRNVGNGSSSSYVSCESAGRDSLSHAFLRRRLSWK